MSTGNILYEIQQLKDSVTEIITIVPHLKSIINDIYDNISESLQTRTDTVMYSNGAILFGYADCYEFCGLVKKSLLTGIEEEENIDSEYCFIREIEQCSDDLQQILLYQSPTVEFSN